MVATVAVTRNAVSTTTRVDGQAARAMFAVASIGPVRDADPCTAASCYRA